jgi:hypothetical protein
MLASACKKSKKLPYKKTLIFLVFFSHANFIVLFLLMQSSMFCYANFNILFCLMRMPMFCLVVLQKSMPWVFYWSYFRLVQCKYSFAVSNNSCYTPLFVANLLADCSSLCSKFSSADFNEPRCNEVGVLSSELNSLAKMRWIFWLFR